MAKAQDKLIELRPGSGLNSGLTPSVLPSTGAVWRDGAQVWFQDAMIEQALGEESLISPMNRQSKSMAQAFVSGKPRLYYENLGIISYFEENQNPVTIGALAANGDFDMVPWGTWLALTDDKTQPKLWKGTGDFIDIGGAEFNKAKILKKLGQYLLAFNTNSLPSGYHWSDASDPEDWTPTLNNTAGNAPIRDLDSDIVAVADLGAALGMYSRDYMLVVQYVGYPDIFGTPTQGLSGIGAASKHSVVSLGRENWGLCKGGIFVTNGSSYTYVDKPAVGRWLQETVDWERAEEITSYYDEQMELAVWSVPSVEGGFREIAVRPKEQRTFTFLGTGFGAALERGVFSYPIVAKPSSINKRSVLGAPQTSFVLKSQLWNAGDHAHTKSWDYLIVEGSWSAGARVRVGFNDEPKMETISWNAWEPLAYRVPFGPRESIFLALEFDSDVAIQISGITVFGKKAGEG